MLESIERLRKWACLWDGMRKADVTLLSGNLMHFADEIQREVQDRYMKLPVDADGEMIHLGDKVDCGEHFGPQEVEGFIHGSVAFHVYDPQPARICTCPAHNCRRYRKPTVEDVLCEMLDAVDDDRAGQDEIISKYAKMLQLKENA